MSETAFTFKGLTGSSVRSVMVWVFQALILVVTLFFSTAFREYGIPKMVIAEVAILGLAILWLVSMVLDGEILIVDTSLYYTLLVFLAVQFISLFQAVNVFYGLDTLFRDACFFLLAILTFHIVQSPRHMCRLVGVMVVSGGIVAAIGLAQHNDIYHFYAPFQTPVSTIGNVNFVAQYYNVVFPIALVMLVMARRIWAQIGIGAACFFMACHLVVLGSRGGWLGGVTTLGIFGGVFLWRHHRVGRRLMDTAVMAVVLVGLGWPVFWGMLSGIYVGPERSATQVMDDYWMRVTRRIENAIRLEDDSSRQRVYLWEDTLRLILDQPVLGVGAGNFELNIPKYASRASLEVKRRREESMGMELMAFSAHNEYLEVWAEMGLLGLGAFGFLLYQLITALYRLLQCYIHGRGDLLVVGFAAAVSATLVHAFFSSNLQQPVSSLHFWLVVGMAWSLKLNADGRAPLELLSTGARRVALGLMVTCGVMLVITIAMGARTLMGEYLYRQGEIAFQRKAYADAAGLWQRAAAYGPTRQFAIYQSLGTSLYNEKKWTEAISMFEKSLSHFPNNARVRYLLGRALVKAGRAQEAVSHLRAATALNPLVAEFPLGLAEALFQTGDLSGARQALDASLALDAQNAEAHQLMGAVYKRQGDLDAAVMSYRRALDLDPTNDETLNSLAVAYTEQQNLGAAREIFDRLIAEVPGNIDYRFNRAVALVMLKDYSSALEALQTVAQHAPNYVRAYVLMGQVLDAMGHTEEAQRAYREALRQKPNDPVVKGLLERESR